MSYLCPLPKKGLVAEWLGSALQKLLQRFESARDLTFFPASAGFFLLKGGLLPVLGPIFRCRTFGAWQLIPFLTLPHWD